MVGRGTLGSTRREALLGGDSPVVVDLVLDLRLDVVVTGPLAAGRELGLVGELVLNATKEANLLAHDAGEVGSPAVDKLEGVVDAVLELLVTAGPEQFPREIETTPVEGVLVVLGLVDKLWPDLLPGLKVPLAHNAEVELVADFEVQSGLHSDFALLVVLTFGLRSKNKNLVKYTARNLFLDFTRMFDLR